MSICCTFVNCKSDLRGNIAFKQGVNCKVPPTLIDVNLRGTDQRAPYRYRLIEIIYKSPAIDSPYIVGRQSNVAFRAALSLSLST